MSSVEINTEYPFLADVPFRSLEEHQEPFFLCFRGESKGNIWRK